MQGQQKQKSAKKPRQSTANSSSKYQQQQNASPPQRKSVSKLQTNSSKAAPQNGSSDYSKNRDINRVTASDRSPAASSAKSSVQQQALPDSPLRKNQDVQKQIQKMQSAMKVGIMNKYQAMLDEKRDQAKLQIAKATSGLQPKDGSKMDAQELAIENERLKSTLVVLQQKMNSQKDYEEQIDTMKKKNEELEAELKMTKDARNVLKNDNDFLHVKILNLEEELHQTKQELIETKQQLDEANQTIIDLLEQLRDLEFQLQQAQAKIADLLNEIDSLRKNQAIYIPKKNDNIDVALSSFINKFPEREKMNILFLRESEGVYQFGQKRVYVKIEKGNQIQVRVGGGYMHIDQFIRQYTPLEVEKIERTNVIDRFSDKLIMQKISSNVAYRAHEQSPIRSPQRPRSVDKKTAMRMSHSGGVGQVTSRFTTFGSPSTKQSSPKKSQRSSVAQMSGRRQIDSPKKSMASKRMSQVTSPNMRRVQSEI